MDTDISSSLGQLGISEEQTELLRVATEFCREKSPPEKVRSLIGDARGYDADTWAEIGQLGWLGIAIPESLGGSGLGIAEAVPIAEQMGRVMMATPFISTTVAAQLLLKGGSDAQQQEWLPRIAAGEVTAGLALGEEGDAITALGANESGGFMLSGSARLVEHANSADILILSFQESGHPRLGIVRSGDLRPDMMRREIIIDETRRAYEITFEGFEIDGGDVMPEAGVAAALGHAEMVGAVLFAAEMVGGTFRVVDYTADYLRTRTQFGKVIGSYQALKHPLVDAFVNHERARSHLYAAAHSFGDQGRGEVAVRMAKAQGEKAYSFAADRAIQFHGGFGFTYDCDAGLHRRRALYDATRFGDARTQKRKLAALLF